MHSSQHAAVSLCLWFVHARGGNCVAADVGVYRKNKIVKQMIQATRVSDRAQLLFQNAQNVNPHQSGHSRPCTSSRRQPSTYRPDAVVGGEGLWREKPLDHRRVFEAGLERFEPVRPSQKKTQLSPIVPIGITGMSSKDISMRGIQTRGINNCVERQIPPIRKRAVK